MNYGKITFSDKHGTILKEGVVSFWNAGLDETGPCVCITMEDKELLKFLATKLPKTGALLQIELPLAVIKKVANE